MDKNEGIGSQKAVRNAGFKECIEKATKRGSQVKDIVCQKCGKNEENRSRRHLGGIG